MTLFRRTARKEGRDRFPGYSVRRLVHSGDKSFVFEATKLAGAPVAIKLYTRSYDRAAAGIERKYGIQSEAQVGMLLNPASAEGSYIFPIVATIGEGKEYGGRSGARYIVQEFVQGVNLKHLIACSDPTVEARTGSLVLQMCRALRAVHKKGLVFRDVCSDNMIVRPDGTLKLIDLGFAAPAGLAFAERSGTPSYMSPEQIRGEPLGFETDIYSLGVVAYELLAARLPFVSSIPGSDDPSTRRRRAEVMRMHLSAPVPPLPAEPWERARAICEALPRCLAKNRRDRFYTIDELIAALV